MHPAQPPAQKGPPTHNNAGMGGWYTKHLAKLALSGNAYA